MWRVTVSARRSAKVLLFSLASLLQEGGKSGIHARPPVRDECGHDMHHHDNARNPRWAIQITWLVWFIVQIKEIIISIIVMWPSGRKRGIKVNNERVLCLCLCVYVCFRFCPTNLLMLISHCNMPLKFQNKKQYTFLYHLSWHKAILTPNDKTPSLDIYNCNPCQILCTLHIRIERNVEYRCCITYRTRAKREPQHCGNHRSSWPRQGQSSGGVKLVSI